MRVWILAGVLIFGMATSVFALGNATQEKPGESYSGEVNGSGETATMLVGVSETQEKNFQRAWKKTQPRWEAEENGRRLEKEGFFREAIEEYEKAVSLSEADLYAKTSHRALARLYEKTGQCDPAVKELEWMIEHFKKMNYPNKDLLNEYISTRNRLLLMRSKKV